MKKILTIVLMMALLGACQSESQTSDKNMMIEEVELELGVKEGESLVKDIQDEVIEEKIEEKNIANLYYLGRASVRIESLSGKVIYIDPYAGSSSDYEKEADLVLVTHQHDDHNNVSMVELKEDGRIIQCPMDIRSGLKDEHNDIKITAVEAYNDYHDRLTCSGFIIEFEGLVIYHSGDTSITDQMKDFKILNIDYALICMDGYYNMSPEKASAAARIIAPKHVIPIHTSKDGMYDEDNAKAFEYESVIHLKPGRGTLLKTS